MNIPSISIADVKLAADKIRTLIHRTPIASSKTLDGIASQNPHGVQLNLVMKCENLQKIGAFKIRGATNAILSLISDNASINPSELTVITHSSGNHAQALAYAAKALNVNCQVVMPSNSADVKKSAVRGYGAVVTECIPTLQAREDGVEEIMKRFEEEKKKCVFVAPYDDRNIIAGQGTLALELIEQAKDAGRPLDILIAPVGGGGMLSGCAIAAKGIDEGIWVVGAEPANADDAYRSFQAKTFIPSVDPKTIADGLRTSLGDLTFPLIMKYVDAIHTVTEEEIVRAMKLVYERVKLIIEPSAAVPLAVALYSTQFRDSLKLLAEKKGKKELELNVGIVFSGGNVDFGTLSALFDSVD